MTNCWGHSKEISHLTKWDVLYGLWVDQSGQLSGILAQGFGLGDTPHDLAGLGLGDVLDEADPVGISDWALYLPDVG